MTAVKIDEKTLRLFGEGGGDKVASDLGVDLLVQLNMEQPEKK
ncbi:putative ATP binding protein [Listeria floridensis FSL S10-1187]|uniref:ATP binding protein n=1 Tax=Listeria floridensis FSL S10-1187 TaxID=1265817 RepID=A0ABP3AUP8_9LIST|nr:putative ATP binding protein [Listeria floridensis FSL S10-1187]